jgi:hypothetical protein
VTVSLRPVAAPFVAAVPGGARVQTLKARLGRVQQQLDSGTVSVVRGGKALLRKRNNLTEHEHRRIVFTPEIVVRASSGSTLLLPQRYFRRARSTTVARGRMNSPSDVSGQA